MQKIGRDGQQIAARQLGNFPDVAEAGTHDNRLVAELLEVVIDRRHRLYAWVIGAFVILARVLLVPVKDAANKGRDERDLGFRAGNGLMQTEEKRQVAMNAFLFQLLGSANAFPCRSDLDENALTGDSGAFIE